MLRVVNKNKTPIQQIPADAMSLNTAVKSTQHDIKNVLPVMNEENFKNQAQQKITLLDQVYGISAADLTVITQPVGDVVQLLKDGQIQGEEMNKALEDLDSNLDTLDTSVKEPINRVINCLREDNSSWRLQLVKAGLADCGLRIA